MIPKHKNPSRPDRTAHAPYNFVPLPEKIVLAEPAPSQDHYHPDRRTGYMECTLTTESCLYTRTALNPEFFRKWTENSRAVMSNDKEREEYAQFFHLDDAQRPVIPGSSLRGMVRSLVEIVGYGKVQWVTEEPLFFRAVADSSSLRNLYRERMKQPEVRAGYLRRTKQGWEILPAKPVAGRAFARIRQHEVQTADLARWKACPNAWNICVEIPRQSRPTVLPLVHPVKARPNNVSTEAVLVKTGQMEGKNKDFIFGLPADGAQSIIIPENVLHVYLRDTQRSMFAESDILRDMQPIFFVTKDGQLVFFGHTMMFRMPYPHTPYNLVPSHLRSADGLDLTEAIFGYVAQGNRKQGQAGRVFFSDARFESARDGVWFSETLITPAILGSPKPTTFQHYLTQQKPDDKPQLDHYGSPPPHETVIRGHKLYWHKGQVDQRDVQEKSSIDWAHDTQHTQIKPVKAGVSFRFRIHFENLSDIELGALLWVLTLPGEAGKQHRHKLGMGKPFGMGVVRITPTLYLSDRRARYSQLFESDTWRQAERTEPNIHPFIQAFEEYVLAGMDATERGGAKSLKEVERIKMLLKMLEWPGPDRGLTAYMKIHKPVKIDKPVNEYKERPVLPDPLNIEQQHRVPSASPNPRQGQRRRQRGPIRR